MADAFEPALAAVLGRRPATGPPAVSPPGAGPPTDSAERSRLIAEALATYRRAQERLRAGDLSGYSQEIDRLGKILERLAAETR